jgi:hypothetical protein
MKNICIIVLFFLALNAYSQSSNLEQDTKKLIELYQLDASQQGQLKPMLSEKHDALTKVAMLKEKQATKKTRQEAIIKSFDDKFYGILNDEQKVAFQRIKLINKAGMGGNAHSSDEINPALIQGAPAKAKEKATAK